MKVFFGALVFLSAVLLPVPCSANSCVGYIECPVSAQSDTSWPDDKRVRIGLFSKTRADNGSQDLFR